MKGLQLFLVIILLTTSAAAQIGYGVEGGIGMATMKFAPSLSPIHYTQATVNSVAGGKIGGLIDVPLNRHFTFQCGVYMVRKGSVRYFSYYQDDSFHEDVHQTLFLNYTEVPLMLLWKSGMQGKGRVLLGLGPALSYIVYGKNKLVDQSVFSGVAANSNGSYPVSIGTTVGGFDIGLNITAGYEMPTGLFFRATYTDGAKDIGIGTEIDKNRTWNLCVGYLFGKGRNVNKDTDDLIDHTGEKK